jgi:hypothetical protein
MRLVIARADHRCEYCGMHQSLQGATFHVEHILPQSKSGSDEPENLCLACPRCNLLKSSRTHGIDPVTGATVAIFDPLDQHWHDHFQWNGYEITARSTVGRATIELLELNSERRQLIRSVEEHYGYFPPPETNR